MKKLLLILKSGDESAFVCQIDDRAQDDAFVFYSCFFNWYYNL